MRKVIGTDFRPPTMGWPWPSSWRAMLWRTFQWLGPWSQRAQPLTHQEIMRREKSSENSSERRGALMTSMMAMGPNKKTTGQINSICQNDWKHMKTHSIIASSYQSKSLAPGYVKEPPAIRQEFEPPKPAVQGQIPRSLFGGWGYQLERWWIWYGGFLQMGLPQ